MMQTIGLKENRTSQLINILAGDTKVERAVLFGSRAKGTARAGSDIDIALIGNSIHLRDRLQLMDQIDDLWLPVRVDLIRYETINNPALKEHIDRVGIVLFDRSKEG